MRLLTYCVSNLLFDFYGYAFIFWLLMRHFLLLAQKKVTKEKSSHFNAHAG